MAAGAPAIGFFIDEDLPPATADRLRALGVRATSVLAGGRISLSDEEQLQFATSQGLVLVTVNVKDFVEIARSWAASGRSHAGLVFVMTKSFPRRDPLELAASLHALARHETPVQMRDSARFLAKS